MERISCKSCKGTGFVKKTKKMYCPNNIYKLSSHLCVKCENIKGKLNSNVRLCEKCYGDGYFITLPKSS